MGEVLDSLKLRIAANEGFRPSGVVFGKGGPFPAGIRFPGTSRRGKESPDLGGEKRGAVFLSVFLHADTLHFLPRARPWKKYFSIIV
jgi:hypothetical protein